MRILIAPDKFKHSLSAEEVCDIIAGQIRKVWPKAELVQIPLADGGEGTLQILKSQLSVKVIEKTVSDPLFRPVRAEYLFKERTAYIEMARASGLSLLHKNELLTKKTSSFGTGELIKDAIANGAEEIYLMIGGSATTDGGAGMAEALGVEFQDHNGQKIEKIRGEDLISISSCDDSALKHFQEIRFTVLSDVQNPLLGANGAVAVYGPQKGLEDGDREFLESGLSNLRQILKSDRENLPGAGAAGGVGYGLMSFFQAELKSGIEEVMKILSFEDEVRKADLILTGEGKLDTQTLEGKVVAGVVSSCKMFNKPIGIFCGIAENKDLIRQNLEVQHIYEVSLLAENQEDSLKNASKYLKRLTSQMLAEFDHLQ